MAQPGNDWAKQGIVSDFPDNSHQGVAPHPYTNSTPLSFATKEDGKDDRDIGGPNRDQLVIPGRSGWLIKPAID